MTMRCEMLAIFLEPRYVAERGAIARWLRCLAMTLVCLGGMSASRIAAQDIEDEEPIEYQPGLVATYTDSFGTSIERVDEMAQFDWAKSPVDARLADGPFQVKWSGRLFVMVPGEYRLSLHTNAAAALSVAGKQVVSAAGDGWNHSPPLELDYGHHPLELTFSGKGDGPKIGLFWQGPQFQLEPITERYLFHDPARSPDETFTRGERLARALRCQACHAGGEVASLPPAPALTTLAGSMSREWMIEWLTRTPQADVHSISRRMPHFKLSHDDAASAADYLMTSARVAMPSIPTDAPTPPAEDSTGGAGSSKKSKEKKKAKVRTKPSAEEGKRLFQSVGCLACHQMYGLGASNLFGGGDLSAVALKRPASFFAAWLADPTALNESHRMPVFALTALERADLAEYLALARGSERDKSPALTFTLERRPDADWLERGRQVVESRRCAACHTLGERRTLDERQRLGSLSAASDWSRSCAKGVASLEGQASYEVPVEDAAALRTYFSTQWPSPKEDKLAIDGRRALDEQNCLACHQRGLATGMAGQFPRLVEKAPDLASLLPLVTPPSLAGVGDKLPREALASIIEATSAKLRPWLSIRMPRFHLRQEERDALVDYLIASDRIPDSPATPLALPSEESLFQAGSRLVTADGFGCTSCHKIGNAVPADVPLNARGTDLSMLGSRVRRPWFDRWVHNPARIVPRMEMPAIQMPVRGVLAENLDVQLTAVWNSLNTRGFDPPPPNAVRVVRARNLDNVAEPANVLTDVLELGPKVYLEPFLVGLANRHNVLFDLERGALAGWWMGDTARQRTRGKSWYWEANGVPVIAPIGDGQELKLFVDGRAVAPSLVGQFAASLDGWRPIEGGVRFNYRALFDAGGSHGAITLRIEQSLTAIRPGVGLETPSGFRREMKIDGLPPGTSLALAVASARDGARLADGGSIALDAPGRPTIATSAATFSLGDDGLIVAKLAADARSPAAIALDYLTNLPADQFPLETPAMPALPIAKLGAVPGFEATRLPLPMTEMPTALAWRRDGTLVFTSLKGRVWQAWDTNGDKLEDRWQVFGDELAAPYGLYVNDDSIDVANKYGVLRLWDRDQDRVVDATEVIASGWGHTADYHDWAIGLPKDASGNYYVALPCQQDDRSPAAAHLRGNGLRLVPRQPTEDNPRRFGLESFCAGLRFPMGLALTRGGDLFATDNQGHYNPYNELNHLVDGARYGFINKLEARDGFSPPFLPPVVEMPHPWMRSINGLCALETPDEVSKETGRSLFGPFEGHLLGCEMNNLRLIRMSLEKVEGEFQGAAYPMSRPVNEGELAFEGPLSCGVAPDGAVYVGNLRDSGWGGGQNTGSLVRLTRGAEYAPGIAEICAQPRGFRVEFTSSLSPSAAGDRRNYTIVSARRVSTPEYGGDDVDKATERITKIDVAADGRAVEIELARMREGFVYEFRLSNLAPESGMFFPDEAYYTLRKLPR